jgi:predicted DNA-binding transcriptional regulator AlpA
MNRISIESRGAVMPRRSSSCSLKPNVPVAVSTPTVSGEAILIGQSKLRRQLNVSPMTFWRWLHNPKMDFPTGVRINNRVYFRWPEVQAWLARQQQAA